jgi:uncharacterized membrane protein required for colicin V production
METVMAGFNFVDGIVAAILVVGIADGTRRGLSGEAATLVATAASGLAAWKFSGWARELILRNTSFSAKEATIAGVVAVFAVAFVALWIIRKSLAAMMQFNFKGKVERIGGALCGLIRYSVITACVLLTATFIPNDKVQKAVADDSASGHFVYQRVRPMYEDLAKKHDIPLPPGPKESGIPAAKDTPPIRDVEAAPPDVITNEVPAGAPLGPVK